MVQDNSTNTRNFLLGLISQKLEAPRTHHMENNMYLQCRRKVEGDKIPYQPWQELKRAPRTYIYQTFVNTSQCFQLLHDKLHKNFIFNVEL